VQMAGCKHAIRKLGVAADEFRKDLAQLKICRCCTSEVPHTCDQRRTPISKVADGFTRSHFTAHSQAEAGGRRGGQGHGAGGGSRGPAAGAGEDCRSLFSRGKRNSIDSLAIRFPPSHSRMLPWIPLAQAVSLKPSLTTSCGAGLRFRQHLALQVEVALRDAQRQHCGPARAGTRPAPFRAFFFIRSLLSRFRVISEKKANFFFSETVRGSNQPACGCES
jgi:hypothetical protein